MVARFARSRQKGEQCQHGSIDTEVSRTRLEQLQANLRDKSWQAALIMQPRDLYYYAALRNPQFVGARRG